VPHDRIHAKEPAHDVERVFERDGHCVVAVTDSETGETVELTVTIAVRDLFVRRLDLAEGESPVGSRVWYRKRGSR
jgi:uncharacterized protein YkuJ